MRPPCPGHAGIQPLAGGGDRPTHIWPRRFKRLRSSSPSPPHPTSGRCLPPAFILSESVSRLLAPAPRGTPGRLCPVPGGTGAGAGPRGSCQGSGAWGWLGGVSKASAGPRQAWGEGRGRDRKQRGEGASEPSSQAGRSGRPWPYLAQLGIQDPRGAQDRPPSFALPLGLLLASCRFVACAPESREPGTRRVCQRAGWAQIAQLPADRRPGPAPPPPHRGPAGHSLGGDWGGPEGHFCP